jgi:TetR/AcrR family transcriptional regulator
MAISKRRKRERERKINEIITAAEKIFFSKGFTRTTMDDIAHELEFTKPALYRYFKSKEDLYYAAVLRGTQILDEMMMESVSSKKTGLEKIMATGVAYCKFYKKHPDYCSLMIQSRNIFSEGQDCINFHELEKHGHNYLKIMYDAIETGKKDGTIRKDIDTFMTALYLVESTIAIMKISETMDEAIKATGKSDQEFITHSLDLMRHSLENKK